MGITSGREAQAHDEEVEIPDWSLLPRELLPIIYKRLPDTADLVRFRAVCRAWRDSAPVSDPPPHLPWVLQRRVPSVLARPEFRFYSPSSGRTYRCPGRGGHSWLHASGAGDGFLVTTVDLSTTTLYNPLTGDRLALPPAPFPPWRNGVVHVVATGDGDAVADRRLVVNTSLERRHFAYCRPGQRQWSMVDGRDDMGHHAYCGGRIFVNTRGGDTLVIDASAGGGAVERVVPPPARETGRRARADYLVESRGELLRAVQVPRGGSVFTASAEDCYFNIYRLDLDMERGRAAWTKLESVGDRVLFFDRHGHGFSFAANDSAELRRDCVYFVRERRTWVEAGDYRFLFRYSVRDGVRDGSVDRVVSLPNTFGDTWIVPTLCRSD